MTAGIVESYRGFRIEMSLAEMPTEWIWTVAINREGRNTEESGMRGFSQSAGKSEADALVLGIKLLKKAERQIDSWHEARES